MVEEEVEEVGKLKRAKSLEPQDFVGGEVKEEDISERANGLERPDFC